MGRKRTSKNCRKCVDCIHEWACQAWNVGNIHNMNATNCAVYETVKESIAYLIGFLDGKAVGSGKTVD